jgi:enamine deaminase RidA (YjgF/YER057c/UK114 family)
MNPEHVRYNVDVDLDTLRLPHRTQQCLSARVGGDGSLFSTMRQKIAGLEGQIISQFIMAGCSHFETGMREMGDCDWPITWIQGDACRSGQVYSSQITTISGVDLQPIFHDGTLVGYHYEDECARFCRLSGLRPPDSSLSRKEQTRALFEHMEAALACADMTFTDTVRTWLYLDRLLEWYDEFNEVRTHFFEHHGVFDQMVPASTGIGAANPWGTALLADLLAVVPKGDTCRVEAVISPMQCPALDYKSSFSRAIELSFPSHRELLISGTASIDAAGKSVHPGNPAKQIDHTMQVVEAILKSRGMDWQHLSRGIAYFKSREDVILWEDWAAAHRLPRFSLAISHADVCRNDLLFEIELDAVDLGAVKNAGMHVIG